MTTTMKTILMALALVAGLGTPPGMSVSVAAEPPGAVADKDSQADALLTEKMARLEEAIAKTKEEMKGLEAAVAKKDKAATDQLLAEMEKRIALITATDFLSADEFVAGMEKLIPNDPRIASMRKTVEAAPGPKKKVITFDLGGGVNLEVLLVRPGSFFFGAGNTKSGADNTKVKTSGRKMNITKPFYLGKYEVTQEQWEAVMGKNPNKEKAPKDKKTGAVKWVGPKYPVTYITWQEIEEFSTNLTKKVGAGVGTFQVPFEAQWEYACRAGTTSRWHFGDDLSLLQDYAWYRQAGIDTQTLSYHPVGEKKPNQWGFYDMYGNVWEYCQEFMGALSPGMNDPVGPLVRGPKDRSRSQRGGQAFSIEGHCTSGCRDSFESSQPACHCGFRIALIPTE